MKGRTIPLCLRQVHATCDPLFDHHCASVQLLSNHIQGYWTPPEEVAADVTEDTFSLPTLPPIDEKLIADAPPNLRGGRRTVPAAWEDESGVVPSDIQVKLRLLNQNNRCFENR